AGLPFLVDGGTFVVAALLVAMLGGTYRAERSHSEATLRAEIGEGLRWLWGHTVLRTLSIMAGITNMLVFGIIAIFVLFIQDIVGLGDVGYGLIISALGVGGLLGAFVSGRLVRRLGPGTTLLGSVGLQAFSGLAMGITSEAWLVAAMAAAYGLSITSWNVVAVSLRQSLTPDPLRGRVASVARLLAWGTQPVGALLGGAVASWVGLRGPFFVAAALSVVLLIVTAPIVNNRRISALTSGVDSS
ncbi:MAG: MFS transporter, partial [Acidimicrobiia bacterium]